MPETADCLIALGSNVGEREAFLNRAIKLLSADENIDDVRRSSWHATRPVGGPAGQGDFLNGAATFRTTLSPHELLALLNDIEQQVGRERIQRWGPRVIDLDILLHGDEIVTAEDVNGLTIPHPRMAFRRFVLEPAAEVAGEMRHPVIGWTMAELLDHLKIASPYFVIVSADSDRAAAIAADVVETVGGEKIQPIDQLAELRSLPMPPKLLIHEGEVDQAFYTGPTLDITGMSPDQAKTEIVAAIEAMRE